MDNSEEKLIRIQKSTRTTMPFFVPIHNYLRMKFRWYYNWHLWHNSSKAHLAVLSAAVLGVSLGLFSFIGNIAQPSLISAAVGDNWIVTGAGDVSFNQTYYYAGTHNGADYYSYGSGATARYLFKATNPLGTPAWRLNSSLQADSTPPVSASYYTFSDPLPGNPWNVGAGTSGAPSLTAGSTDGVVAGTIFTNTGESTPIGGGKTVALSINGGAKVASETNSDGQFLFTNQTYIEGSVISIFLDDETEKASYVTIANNSSAIADIVMVQNMVKLGHYSAGPITNTTLDTADNIADVDLGVSIASGNATFADGQTLWVRYEKTYAPGGNVICDDIRVNGTMSMQSNLLTVSGSFLNTGTFTTELGVTFDSTTAETLDAGGANLGSISFNGIGGEWTTSGTLASGYIYLKHGTVKGTADIAVNNGDCASSYGEDGSFNMTGGTLKVQGTGIMDNYAPWVLNNLTLGNGTDNSETDKQTTFDLTVNGTLSIAATHVYHILSNNVYLKGDFINNGSLNAGNSTFIFSGTAQQNVGTATFNNIAIQNSSTDGVVFGGNLTTNGTFTDITPSSKVTFHSGSTYNFNAINLNGQATTTRIILTSSTSTSAWNLNVAAASPSASYVEVKDSVANKEISALIGGKDSGGNTLWLFPALKTVSGTVYSDTDKTGNIGAGKTIALSLDGGAVTTVETGEGGTYSFSDVLVPQNGVVSMFISGELEKGSIIFRTGVEDISYNGIEWYVGCVKPSFWYESDHAEITNSELAVADDVNNSDLGVSVSSGTATFADGRALYVWTNKTYRPGGSVTADNVEIDGTLNMESNALTVSGSFTNSGTFTTTGVVLFDATSTGKNITTGGFGLGTMTFNGVGGEWALQDDLTASSVHLMKGRLYDNARTVTVSGDILVDEVENVLTSTGTWIQAANGSLINSSLGSENYPTTWYANKFKHLIIGAGVTSTLTGDVYVEKITLREDAVVCRANDSWGISVHHPADDFITMAAGSSFSGGKIRVSLDPAKAVTYHKALSITIPIAIQLTAATDNAKLSLTGNWVTGGLLLYGRLGSNTESKAVTFDTNGNNLTVNGNVDFGWGTEQYKNGYFGKLILGSGTHYITGNISVPQRTFGTQGFMDFGTSNTYIGGNLDLSSTTVTPGTATVHMNSTSAGKTITLAGQALPNLEFNGIGGEWTLQDDLTASSLTVTNGKLIDNGKNVNVGGNVIISPAENSLVSTGVWTMTANGDIANGGYDASFPPTDNSDNLVYNSFYDFRLANNVTARRISYFNTRKLFMGDSAVLSSDNNYWYLRIWNPYQDDFLSYASSQYSITGGSTVFYGNSNRQQGAINLGESLLVGYKNSGTIGMGGNWNINGNLDVSGNYFSNDELTAAVLDTNGYNLDVTGNVKVGHSNRNAENAWAGKIKFASGTHNIRGKLYTPGINTVPIQGMVGGYSHGYYDFGSSRIYVGGNIDLNQYTTVSASNTSTIFINGTQSQIINTILPLNNLTVVNSSAEGVSFASGLTLSGSLTNETPASKITFAAGATYSFQNLVLNGGTAGSRLQLRSSVSGNTWKMNLLSNEHRVSYVDAADSNANGGVIVKANDGTSVDSGNNSNWLFGNFNTEISRVAVTPNSININPNKTYQFQAKAYNILGVEVPGSVIWNAKSAAGSISPSGLFTAGSSAGNYSDAITATMGEKSASVDVNIVEEEPYIIPGWIIISPDSKVLKPREEYKFAGKIYDTTGLLIENASPEWRLVDGGGEITTDGLFVAGEKEGTFINSIVASYADVRSYATVVIQSDKPIIVKKETIISQIINTGKAVLETAKSIAKNDPVRETALVVTAVATASAGVSGMLGLVSAQMGIKEYLLFIINYFLSLRAAKRKNKFGIVFDESTQRPVQGAMVRLFDFKTMRLVSTAITDKNGSYIFIVQPGEYVMSVVKPGFAFPSNMIRISQNLVDNYIGQTIVVDNDHPVINQKIPIDPSSNQQIRLGLVFRLLNSIYFRPVVLILGSIMTVYALFLIPSTLNFIVAGGFVLLWLAESFIQNRNVRFSKVLDQITGKPISLALIRVLSPENKLLETFISDQYGRVLPKTTQDDHIIVEKNGYAKIIEQANVSGLIERKKYSLRKSS